MTKLNMLPILLDLKILKIYTFGVFLVLAFFWASFILWKQVRLTSYKEEEIFDGMFLALLGSLFFGRFLYVVLNFQKFGFDILKILLVNGYPGFSLYGILFGGLVVLYVYFMSKKISFLEAVDYLVGPLFIALSFGKLGSFFSGAEIGTKTKFILAVKYVGFDGLRHLTPLYEAVFFFLGFWIAYRILFEIRKEQFKHGFAFYFFIWYFSLSYWIFDFIKEFRLIAFGKSFNATVSLILLLTFSFYFLYYFRSLMGEKIVTISNLIFTYVKRTKQSIRAKAEKKA